LAKTIYKIWCEWDIGQEDIFFENEQEALDFAVQLWDSQNMDEEVDMTLAEAMNNGLLSIDTTLLRN
jgi:hypothetical protein